MIRGTRRPGGAGRKSGGRSLRGGKGGRASDSQTPGCVVLLFAGSTLASGAAAGLALVMVTR